MYKFLDNANLDEIFNYCSNHLEIILYKEEVDRYLVEMPYDIGQFNQMKTNLVEVITIPNTNKILTIYPIAKVGRYNVDKIKERNQSNEKQ